MRRLPLVSSSCSLDERALAAQLARYRRAGEGARLLVGTPRRLVVELAPAVSLDLVDELVAVERGCCPFFTLDWDAPSRRLAISVVTAADEPALAAIAAAFG